MADLEALRARIKPADELYAAGKIDQAITQLQQLADEEVDYFRPYFNLGFLHRLRGESDTAINYLEIAVAKAPDFADAWFVLGQARHDRGELAAAEAALAEATRLDPANIRAANWRARELWLLGRHEEAAELVRETAARIGWETPRAKHLTFSQEPWFLTHVANWRRHLAPIAGKARRALEIGCMEGMSAIWTVEHLLAPDGHLFVNDIAFRPNFVRNTRDAGIAERLVTLHGSSALVLPLLEAEAFDFIYVDGDHRPEAAFRDAVNAAALATAGGMIVLDDYGKENERTQIGLDLFLSLFAGNLEVVAKGYQLFLRRNAAPLTLAGDAAASLKSVIDGDSADALAAVGTSERGVIAWLRNGGARFG